MKLKYLIKHQCNWCKYPIHREDRGVVKVTNMQVGMPVYYHSPCWYDSKGVIRKAYAEKVNRFLESL